MLPKSSIVLRAVLALCSVAFVPPAVAVDPSLLDRCGVPAQIESVGNASSAFQPPRPNPGDFPNSILSPAFIVHYRSGGDSLYALSVSDAAERARRVYVDTLGCTVPPSDTPMGGDGRIDVYVQPPSLMGGVWGVTYPETEKLSPYLNSYTSWVAVVDTMGIVRRQTVTAHEVFHVVQLGYDRHENLSFLEMLSTWAEERVFDDNNTYYEVLPAFFNNPAKALFGQTYSNVPWLIFLTERYGDSIIAPILAECGVTAGGNTVEAHEVVLGHPFVDDVQEFTLWNYFTGGRDDNAHYPEGALWPMVSVEKRSTCTPFFGYRTANKMGRFGSNYFFFDRDGATDPLRLRISPEYFGTSVLTVTRFTSAGRATQSVTYPMFVVSDSVDVSDWPQCDSLLAIVQIDDSNQAESDVCMSALHPRSPPPSAPYVLLLDRDDCRRPFDGVGDAMTPRDGEESVFATNFAALSVAFVQRDSIPADLTACRGVFVVGGYGSGGVNLGDDELAQLMAFMDGGGDVYLEGRRFGGYADPGATSAQSQFWQYFGTGFVAGGLAAAGNVSAWSTAPASPVGAHSFTYDFMGAPDDLVGRLVPTSADTLAVDASGLVRMTVRMTGASTRVHSTLLLGGSSGVGASTPGGFLEGVLALFGVPVSALSVVRMNVSVGSEGVQISGELSGYNGESLSMTRESSPGTIVDVPLAVLARGGAWTVEARDRPGPHRVRYRLLLAGADGAVARVLWQASVDATRVATPLALLSVYPNPTTGPMQIVVDSPDAQRASIELYDVSGRRLLQTVLGLERGSNTIRLAAPGDVAAGVYFVRVAAGSARADHKVLIMR